MSAEHSSRETLRVSRTGAQPVDSCVRNEPQGPTRIWVTPGASSDARALIALLNDPSQESPYVKRYQVATEGGKQTTTERPATPTVRSLGATEVYNNPATRPLKTR